MRWLQLILILMLPGVSLAQEKPLGSVVARRAAMTKMVADGVRDPRVLQSVADTPRHLFVPLAQRHKAYLDLALPIGNSVTISPPYVVAFMTEQLHPQATDRVLEIGTGSGYQAAILSPLVKQVYSIEIVEPVGVAATKRLSQLKYKNIKTRIGDGYKGWPEHAPFDKIIVTCSPENIPQPLVDQLKEGGRMVIPLGERYHQSLCLVIKRNGKLERETLEGTFFIPMTGRAESLRVKKPAGAPVLLNGSFEEVANRGAPLSWYYLRQYQLVDGDTETPDQRKRIQFTNQTPGRMSQALQAFGVDGEEYREIELSVWVRTRNVKSGQASNELAYLQLRFYDERWKNVGVIALGPFSGSSAWSRASKAFRIPRSAKLGVLGVGLFGATGTASFDDVQVDVRKLESNY